VDLTVEASGNRGRAVLALRGDVDIATAPMLRQRLLELAVGDRPRVVVDLDGVDLLDSSGLGVLVGALKRYRTRGGDIVIVCNDLRLLEIFSLTGLTSAFKMYPSVSAALAAA